MNPTTDVRCSPAPNHRPHRKDAERAETSTPRSVLVAIRLLIRLEEPAGNSHAREDVDREFTWRGRSKGPAQRSVPHLRCSFFFPNLIPASRPGLFTVGPLGLCAKRGRKSFPSCKGFSAE